MPSGETNLIKAAIAGDRSVDYLFVVDDLGCSERTFTLLTPIRCGPPSDVIREQS